MWSKLVSLAKTFPEGLAIQSPDKSITYAQLLQEITKGAGYFRSLGLQDQCIGIALQDKTEEVLCCLAALISGNHFFFVPHHSFKAGIDQVPVDWVVSDLWEGMDQNQRKTSWAEINSTVREIQPWWEEGSYSDRSFCVYATSGSAGLSKYVLHDYQSIEEDTLRQIEENRIGIGDKLDFLFAASFSSSLASIFPALCAGATLVVHNLENLKLGDIPDFWEKYGVTMTTLTPSAFRAVCRKFGQENRLGTQTIRFICLGGEPVVPSDLELLRRFFHSGTELQLAYASTETRTITSFKTKADTLDFHDGFPVRKKQIKILDAQGKPCEPGQIGEIYLQSCFISKGYWRDRKFYPHPLENGERVYATGDLGCWHQEGYIQLKGRAQAQQKVNSTVVDLNYLESVLTNVTAAPCQVLVLRDDLGLEYLVAVVETKDSFDEQKLRASLGSIPELSNVPRKYFFLEQFPLNPHGKVNKPALEVWVKNSTLEYVAAQIESPVQRKVHEIWSRNLGVPILNLNTDFFTELGGDSLTAEFVLEELSQALDLEIPSHAIHEFRSIQRLSEYLAQKSEPKLPCLEIRERKGGEHAGWIIFLESGFFNSYESIQEELSRETLNIASLRLDFYEVLETAEVESLLASWVQLVQDLKGITWVGTSFNGWLAAKLSEMAGGAVVMLDTPSYQSGSEKTSLGKILSRVNYLVNHTLQNPSTTFLKRASRAGLALLGRKIQSKKKTPSLFEQAVFRYLALTESPKILESLLYIYSKLSLITHAQDPKDWKSKTKGLYQYLEITGDHLDACSPKFSKVVSQALVRFHQEIHSQGRGSE